MDAGGATGSGRLVLCAGEPGIGKTRLVEELAGLALARGAAVVWGRCVEADGAPPYWPWRQVQRALGHDADTLLAEAESSEERFRVFEAVARRGGSCGRTEWRTHRARRRPLGGPLVVAPAPPPGRPAARICGARRRHVPPGGAGRQPARRAPRADARPSYVASFRRWARPVLRHAAGPGRR
ncbi:MAG: ATP-binding protein [Acidimicrobiales bacterium]